MQKHRSWQGASETEWQEACRRESAIRLLIECGPVSHARADAVAKDLGISRALVGMFQQRYVKRHEIWHNPHIQNETWLFAAPKIRLLSGG
jgi:hypothetical protein